jgi:RNA polymerase sigma-70 factor (ECF subfamily)
VSVAEPAASGLETAAAARLYERNSSRVFGYCLRMLGSREDAEDASQTTFMQAFRALQRGVVPAFETAWLLTIARNVCLARHRAGRRRRAVELVRDPQDLQELAAGREPDDGSLAGLQEALSRLPEMQRRAFLLREWQERSYAEIAAELGVTVPAVEALLFRARRSLADQLGDGRRRGHAFDLASLAAAVKSALGGAAAAKVAVGAAVVVGAGAAAGGVAQRVDSRAPVQARVPAKSAPAVVQRSSAVPSSGRMDSGMKRSGSAATSGAAQGGRPQVAGGPFAEGPAGPAAPSAPASPANPPDSSAPSAPSTPPPPSDAGATQPSPPPPPVVPEAPAIPPPPAIPEAPAIPPAPVEVPAAPTDLLPVAPPEIPPAPDIPDAPSVPDLPLIP